MSVQVLFDVNREMVHHYPNRSRRMSAFSAAYSARGTRLAPGRG